MRSTVEHHAEDYDDAIPYIPEDINNTMNEGDRERLLRYIDPMFLDSTPDNVTNDADQVFEQERYDLDDREQPELLDDFDDQPEETQMLAPRDYQVELYEKAIKENLIAVLDTGSGKTLIAVLLLKYMAAKERDERLHRRNTKLAFFLVDRVPLVPQQTNVIKANCDANVIGMYGEMGIDKWSEKKWKQTFEENDVCVMTAQILLDTLRHGFVHMDQINLIIFDECHHCTKRHPYNLIMHEHYQRCAPEDRPKIFGMTASPIHGKVGSVESSILTLERNLNSRVYTTMKVKSLNVPREVSVAYFPAEPPEPTRLHRQIRKKIGHIERLRRLFVTTAYAHEQLGSWCCDRLWEYLLRDLDQRVTADTHDLPKDQLMAEDRAIKEAYELAKGAAPDDPDLTSRTLFTDKMIKLLRCISIFATVDDLCCIIFAERRHIVVALNLVIQASSHFKDRIRSDIMIGHGNSEDGDITMKFKEQDRVIQRFRDGELNMIIATNVAEEGLDIQPCNVVIRFDFFHSLISYIQSRGRARKENSKYVILVEETGSGGGQHAKLEDIRRQEKEMKIFVSEHPERNLANYLNEGLDDEDDDDEEDFAERIYMVPSTAATITMHHAVPLVHLYCGSLPSDSFCTLKPVFDIYPAGEGFTCTLRLPSNAAVLEVTSEVARTKAKAKRLAALDIAIQLHKLGALDDHLRPKSSKRQILGEMAPLLDDQGQIIGSRRRRHIYEKRTPRFWELKFDEEEEEDTNLKAEDDKDLMFAHNSAWREERDPHEPISALSHRVAAYKREQAKEAARAPVIEHSAVTTDTNGTTSADAVALDTNGALVETNGLPNGNVDKPGVKAEEEEPVKDIGPGPFVLWMTTILVEIKYTPFQVRHMALITWKELPVIPDIELYSRGNPFKVSFRPTVSSFQLNREAVEKLAEFTLSITSAITNKEFQCPLVDFPYFFAPLKTMNSETISYPAASYVPNQAIDWDEVAQVIAKETPAVDLDDLENCVKDKILIDYADNARRYLIQEISKDLLPHSTIPADLKIRETGYESFAAYYTENFKIEVTRMDQPMVRVQRITKVMNFLMPVAAAAPQEKKRTATFVIPEFCKVFWANASVYQSAMLLPSIMTRLDSYLLIKEATIRYDLPVKDDMILEAYTTPSASMAMNYERLETLGDSLLKFIATIRLYINFPFSNEGELHCLRIRVICNRALYRAAKRLRIYRYVTSHAFNRRYWRPHHFVTSSDTPDTLKELREHMLSDKTLADIVEASLGASYLSSGLEGGLHCAIQMQIPFDEIKKWSDFQPAYIISRDKVPARAEVKALRSVSVPRVEEIAGYKFKTPLLIVEALTHASLPNSTAPCYQRLEFLGDAILDFLVIRYLYAEYPYADPGLITDLKDSCVNNHVLGVICIKNNLHTQIIHYSGRLVRAIEEFNMQLEKMEEDGEAVGEYWTELNVPKVLSDVVESMLGAVFVDAGFNLDPVEQVFEKWMKPLYKNHVTPETLKIHPLRKFTTDLQRLGCESFMLRNHTTSSTAADSQKCVIFLHDKPLATGAADNIKAARRNAATKASLRLEEDPDLLAKICNCSIISRRNKKHEDDDDDE
ncbi:hypothetical protein BJV82DRAFT_718564 [Fennellomyces sp. T-0311]|nr:hypothetical protein BJV82DRAFT_718564 [Fennellomyces sp. T-0311]